MSNRAYDFVVVGAGSNTLTAAAYLAAGGHSVAVLERQPYFGGGCITREVTLPGFRHDLHATNVFLVKANPLIRYDELGLLSRFGLKYIQTTDAYHGSLFEDGSAIRIFTDLDQTCASIAALDRADAEAYRGFAARAGLFVDLLSWGMFSPPADPAVFLELLQQSADGRYLLELMRFSAWHVISTTFRDTRVHTHLYRKTSEMMVTPEKPGTAFALFMILGFSHRYTSGFVRGGSQGFVDALVRCIGHHGGTVVTNTEVTSLRVSGGRVRAVETATGEVYEAKQAVIAGIAPWRLGQFIEGFDPALVDAANRAQPSDFGVFLSSLALKAPVKPRYPAECQSIQINQCCHSDVRRIRRLYDNLMQGKVPGEVPGDDHYYGNFICTSLHDPTRAPAGQATLYLYHMVPMIPAGGRLQDWERHREPFARWLLEGARRYIGNIEDADVLGAHHASPLDMQEHSPSFRNGDVMGLGTFADQFLGGRPTKEFSQFRVPGVERLYLCGPFMHPGGGVTGGGRAVAMRAMSDLGMNLDRAFPSH